MMPDDINGSTGGPNESAVIHTGNVPSAPKCYSSTADSGLAHGAKANLSVDEEEGKEVGRRRGNHAAGVSPTIRYERRGRFAIWPAHLGLVCPSTAASSAAAH
jgi:hypothetical protein